MSIVKFLHIFCAILSYSFSGRSGPGPLGPVRKILVVRSGPEGPQFARSVGTLLHSDLNDQSSFDSTIDAPPGVPGVPKYPEEPP